MSAGPPAIEGEARKIVTVVFTDVAESTRLGEGLDPESLRAVMGRYFEEMKGVLERHGGVVEKFIGDAVMAVFGVPRGHEDDALRAVRAAVEMRAALHSLNDEFKSAWGVVLAVRTGIETGEVVAGDPAHGQSFVAGGAVTTAARLEQAADAGEILIGETTYRLVREAVVAEDVGRLHLKGKQGPVQAMRVLEVGAGPDGGGRRLDSPLVGREHELEALMDALARTNEARAAQVVTVLGQAGVGKSRLTSEFVSRVSAQAQVITGRCLAYGEGITFWPIAGVIRDAARIGERDRGEEAREKILALLSPGPDAELVADRLAPLLGARGTLPGIRETFWALRKLFEQLGVERPLVVVFDDIQWGQPTFLDLLEYVVDWIKSAPVLFICLARPELLEAHPGWLQGKPNATLLKLQPLTIREIDGLITNLAGSAKLAQLARTRIAEVAEGNPLFVEETLRMFIDDGFLQPQEGKWTVAADLSDIKIPPTIHALLTARLDRLEPDERVVIERASVVGRVFWWEAVSELAPPELRSSGIIHLQSLARKELICPHYPEPGHEEAFRFTHILVRDAAYSRIPKRDRAELHERLADWMEDEARQLAGEYEEIRGYHMEQATLLLLELGPPSDRTAALGRRASQILAGAGRRAFARGDMPGAVNLLSRAVLLLPEQQRDRVELLPQLAFALFETGDYSTLQRVVAEAEGAAAASGDARLKAYAHILGLWVGIAWDPKDWAPVAEAEARKAIVAFEALDDDRGLGKAWALLGLVYLERAQFAAAEGAYTKAAAHARLAGDRRDELESLSWLPLIAWAGPSPAEEGLDTCRGLIARAEGDKKLTGTALVVQGALEADLGRFEEARELISQGKDVLREVALTVWLAGPVAQFAGWVELLAGDLAAAEGELGWGYKTLTELGEQSWASTVAAMLAEAVCLQGRHDEAEQLIRDGQSSASADDALSNALLRLVSARVLARRGKTDAGALAAEEAVAIADGTDLLHLRWYVRLGLADMLRLASRADEVGGVLAEARRIADEKRILVGEPERAPS